MVGSLYTAQGGAVLGYRYNILLGLEDTHIARYIENNIILIGPIYFTVLIQS